MVQDRDEVVTKIREAKADLEARYSVRRIGVFGSFVRGSASADSDVDILVELADPTFDNYMDLKFRLEEMFGRKVDLVLADTIKPRLQPIIAREVQYA